MKLIKSARLATSLLILIVGATSAYPTFSFAPEAQQDNAPFTAVVTRDKARFVFPVPAREEWRWREATTKDNAMEYRCDVTVHNADEEYTFGFYLWKHPRLGPGKGSLGDLVAAGQKSLFHVENPRHAVIIRDAGIKVKRDGNNLIVTVEGRKNVERLFSSRPAEVTFKILLLNDPLESKAVAVTYKD